MKGQSTEKVRRAIGGIDRRTLLIGGGVGFGLVVAWGAWRWGAIGEDRSETTFGPYLKVGRDGRLIVAVPQTETGQGIWTALPQLVADEVGADWDLVAVEPAPFAGVFANRFAGEEDWFAGLGPLRRFRLDDAAARITARSTSVRAFEREMRQAGAAAREMLIAAAASRWDVDAADCDTRDSRVFHAGKSLGFGEIAEAAAGHDPSDQPPLRRGVHPVAGKSVPRLDGPAKAGGDFRFAGDVRLPDMLFASARLAPSGGRLTGYSKGPNLVVGEDFIAGIGPTWWAAEGALKAANAQFRAPRSPIGLDALFDDALAAGEAETWLSRGDYQAAVEGSRALTALYRVAPAMHLGLEPLTATARVNGGHLEVWAASQAPELAKQYAERWADGMAVTFYPMPVGDGGGRAMEPDAVPIAIQLARSLRRPVHVSLPPSISQNHDRPSPGALARMYGLPGPGGVSTALKMRLVTASGLGSSLSRLLQPSSKAWFQPEGIGIPYNVPNVRIDAVRTELPFRAGYMRGSPERELTFFMESFADELARAAGIDPLSFRIAMLGSNPRLANCLQRATSAGAWDGGGPGSTMGLAAASVFGSHVALVAEASIGSDQRIQVHRLTASVDCGRVVNPGIVRQQIGGGLIWALEQATVAAPEWIGAVPLSRPIGGLGLSRVGSFPEIRIDLVPSSEPPGGVSGLGIAPLAPAVANAIHAATGRRMRSLPFDPMGAV
jgi:isoquinoline 1-oxidoreductase beta subunit